MTFGQFGIFGFLWIFRFWDFGLLDSLGLWDFWIFGLLDSFGLLDFGTVLNFWTLGHFWSCGLFGSFRAFRSFTFLDFGLLDILCTCDLSCFFNFATSVLLSVLCCLYLWESLELFVFYD